MSPRLLLIDDDDDIRTIASLSLERVGGWNVVAVASGRAAIEAAADGEFDVVVLDAMMPGLDGAATFVRLREGPLPADVPIVFLTAKLQAADRERMRGLGAAGVIAKPFDPMTLPGELARILDR